MTGDDLADFPSFDLSVLNDRQREVLEMRYCANLSFGQIAILIGISAGTTRLHHRRALNVLLDQTSRREAAA